MSDDGINGEIKNNHKKKMTNIFQFLDTNIYNLCLSSFPSRTFPFIYSSSPKPSSWLCRSQWKIINIRNSYPFLMIRSKRKIGKFAENFWDILESQD
jgi:hypothetical protein